LKVVDYKTCVAEVPYETNRTGTHVILQLRTDDGLEGLGFVTPLVAWTIKPLRLAVEVLAESIIGCDPMAAESINASLIKRVSRPQFDGLTRSAAGVIDIALWDLKAKALGQPLYRLLGGKTNEVPAYASWNLWWHYDVPTLVEHAKGHVDRGFRAMKFRLGGVKTAAEAVERTRAMRDAVGDDIELHVDMNWQWTLDKTIAIGRELDPFRLFWIEDPIPADNVEGLRQISEALTTPICAGETYYEARQFHSLLGCGGVDMVMIDLEVGGITQWVKMAHIAESYGVPVASHMCSEIAAHAVAGLGGLIVEYVPWAEAIFNETPPIKDGKLILSERPGLGLELNPAGLKKYTLN
jgi:L-alanine-DL-glutamate epimerase-like enolase superfamily enzyme